VAQVKKASSVMLLGAAVHFGVPLLVDLGVGSAAALAYVAYGFEACAAWLIVALAFWGKPLSVVAVWLAVESALRAGCRLAFPLTAPPPGGNLCSAATGTTLTAWLGIAAAALVALYVWRHDARPHQ
jgi:hypothetical protein